MINKKGGGKKKFANYQIKRNNIEKNEKHY